MGCGGRDERDSGRIPLGWDSAMASTVGSSISSRPHRVSCDHWDGNGGVKGARLYASGNSKLAEDDNAVYVVLHSKALQADER